MTRSHGGGGVLAAAVLLLTCAILQTADAADAAAPFAVVASAASAASAVVLFAAAAGKMLSLVDSSHHRGSTSSVLASGFRTSSSLLALVIFMSVFLARGCCAADGTSGTRCSTSRDCASGFRCVCPDEAMPPPQPSYLPQNASVDVSPACRSYRTPQAQVLDTSSFILSKAWRIGTMLVSSYFATARATTESQTGCTCVADDPQQPPPPQLQPPPPLAEVRTAISISGEE